MGEHGRLSTADEDNRRKLAHLNEDQKRENHIKSEQERRTLIRQGFEDLGELMPGLKGGGFSKSAVLMMAADWLEELTHGNEILQRRLDQLGGGSSHNSEFKNRQASEYPEIPGKPATAVISLSEANKAFRDHLDSYRDWPETRLDQCISATKKVSQKQQRKLATGTKRLEWTCVGRSSLIHPWVFMLTNSNRNAVTNPTTTFKN